MHVCSYVGGMAAAIDGGMPKLLIEESAAKKQARIDSRQETVHNISNRTHTDTHERT